MQHDVECARVYPTLCVSEPCTCGLDALRQRVTTLEADLRAVREALTEALFELELRRQTIMHDHAHDGSTDTFMLKQEEKWRAALAPRARRPRFDAASQARLLSEVRRLEADLASVIDRASKCALALNEKTLKMKKLETGVLEIVADLENAARDQVTFRTTFRRWAARLRALLEKTDEQPRPR